MADTTIPSRSTQTTTEIVWPRLGLRPVALLGLLTLLIGVFLFSLTAGSVRIPLDNIITILLGGQPDRATWSNIVINFRLPKALTAALAGAALGVSGLQMQTLFRNPLADPFVLGVSSGASLGVALVVLSVGASGTAALLAVSGLLSNVSLVVAACVGSSVVLAIVLLLARRVQSSITLLIIGLMIGYLTSAVVSLLIYFSVAERVTAYIAWTFGSFGGVTWSQMQVLAPTVLLGLVIAHVLVKPLNALLLGETYARSMGLPVQQVRFWILVSASVLAGAVTAFCGPIAFLGIAVPHFCRSLLATSDHRVLVPAVTLLGATCAIIADMIAQMPGSETVLPLNAVMSLIGAPVVVWVLLRRNSIKASFAS
ncbi:MAG: iron ABC transporter permease [Blastochloris sp.]|nr:iron ABC transporter permease [Blastochloris sp.]